MVLGGAFNCNGNVNPAAEANIFGDPDAADFVYGCPMRCGPTCMCSVAQPGCLHPALCSKAGRSAGFTHWPCGLQDESSWPRCHPPVLHEGPADRTSAWARSAWAVPVPDITVLPSIPQVSPLVPAEQLCSQLLHFSTFRLSITCSCSYC